MSDDAETVEKIRELAAMTFEPWVPGMEAEMTPANLTEAANDGPFIAAYFAYKTMFRTKDDMAAACCRTPGIGQELVDTISGAAEWFEIIAGMMRAAALRHMSALAAAELERGEIAELEVAA